MKRKEWAKYRAYTPQDKLDRMQHNNEKIRILVQKLDLQTIIS